MNGSHLLTTYILDKSNILLGSHLSLKSCAMERLNEEVCSYFRHKHTPLHSGVVIMILPQVNC